MMNEQLKENIRILNNNRVSPRVIPASSYLNNYTEVENNAIRSVYNSFNIARSIDDYNNLRHDYLTSFNKYGAGGAVSMSDLRMSKGIPRVFFTRPDLNFFIEGSYEKKLSSISGAANDGWVNYVYKNNPKILESLTKSYSTNHHFLPMLSNGALSFDINDEKLETVEHGETFTGWKVRYGRHNIGTKNGGSFSIAYNETDELEIYKLHKTWVDYIAKVYRGEFIPKFNYINNRKLDYAVSAYYFLCGPDGETILFWSKYVGVFPTTIPAGVLEWSKGDFVKMPEMNIEYEYAWKDDMDPAIIADFNYNAFPTYGKTTSDTLDTNFRPSKGIASYYDTDLLSAGYAFAGRPFIRAIKRDDGSTKLVLKYENK